MYSANWRYRALYLLLVIACGLLIISRPATAEKHTVQTSPDGTVTVPWEDRFSPFNSLVVYDQGGSERGRYPVIQQQGWVLSGLPDGLYSLYLIAPGQKLPLNSIEVRHYSLALAGSLFVAGLFMFLYLLFTLKRGASGSDHD